MNQIIDYKKHYIFNEYHRQYINETEIVMSCH